MDKVCINCGHSEYLHKMTSGYMPYGHCNYQHDLCGCSNYQSEVKTETATPGEMHPVDKAFYDLTRQQRDRAWLKNEHLEKEVAELRRSRFDLLEMIKEQGKRAEAAELQADILSRQLTDTSRSLQACDAQLHDQKQHDLGQQCAELQTQLDQATTILATIRPLDVMDEDESLSIEECAERWKKRIAGMVRNR